MRLTISLLVVTMLVGVTLTVIGIAHDSTAFAEDTKVIGYTYKGKVLLSPSDYDYFKEVVARSDVDIRSLDVYNSNPVLVVFTITTPADISRFWGEQITRTATVYTAPPSERILSIGLACGGVLLVFACFLICCRLRGRLHQEALK